MIFSIHGANIIIYQYYLALFLIYLILHQSAYIWHKNIRNKYAEIIFKSDGVTSNQKEGLKYLAKACIYKKKNPICIEWFEKKIWDFQRIWHLIIITIRFLYIGKCPMYLWNKNVGIRKSGKCHSLYHFLSGQKNKIYRISSMVLVKHLLKSIYLSY